MAQYFIQTDITSKNVCAYALMVEFSNATFHNMSWLFNNNSEPIFVHSNTNTTDGCFSTYINLILHLCLFIKGFIYAYKMYQNCRGK